MALAAAGISAAYLSIFHAYSTAVALPGILALPTYHADNYIHIIIGVLIAIIGAFVGTLVIGIKQEPEQQAEVSKEISEKIYSPVNGKMQLLETVKDDVFSQKLMGDGVAFISNDGKIYAPISGEITMLFDTHHAIGIRSESGIEILIHVGLDTINLKGAGFNPQVKVGDKVTNQQLLLTFDQEAIIEKGYDPIIPLVITNHSEFKDIRKKMNGTDLSVQTGDWIIEIEN
ncbi:PTS glucose transporter subunit IIA [Enterococcus termitis]